MTPVIFQLCRLLLPEKRIDIIFEAVTPDLSLFSTTEALRYFRNKMLIHDMSLSHPRLRYWVQDKLNPAITISDDHIIKGEQ